MEYLYVEEEEEEEEEILNNESLSKNKFHEEN